MEERLAVFDFDGTLYGELFPIYIDHSLLLYRVLYDESYEASEETRAYALSMEEALRNQTSVPKRSADFIAELFK